MPRASTTPTIYRRTSRPPKRQRLHQSARTLISLRQFIRVPFRLVGKVRKPLGELVATRQDQPTSLQVQKNQLLFLDRFEPPLSAHNPPRAVSTSACCKQSHLFTQIVEHDTTTALMRRYEPRSKLCAIGGTLESKNRRCDRLIALLGTAARSACA